MTFTIPNLLSLFRMGLVPLFIISVIDGQALRALVIFLLAGITDALDGFIARVFKQQSLLGTYLDPIADKLLLVSAYVTLSIPQLNQGIQIPLWVTVLVIARDVLLVVVALILYLAAGIRSFPPTLLSKINTALQVVAVVLVLISGTFPEIRWIDLTADTTIYLVAALTLISGLDYIVRSNRLQPAQKTPQA
ncbi:MAG TPA: CDP-alcohol phosphatidyltransferase family protein [Thermoanaerobaculia bacterium]|nr:CDP-alcohol phosphatidyltransferase family protein [Thermoanaerobaculia bacterium]